MSIASKTCIVDHDGRFQYGRFPEPFASANIADAQVGDYSHWLRSPTRWNGWARSWRLKEWHFLSINHDEIFVAFAVAQLGYVSNLFIYAFDKRKQTMHEWGERFLFGRNLNFGDSSIAGETLWGSRSHRVIIQNGDRGWTVDLRAGKDLEGRFFIERDEAMALVFPLAESRAGYTHKEAGNRVRGQLRVHDRNYELTPANCLGASDWSRSFSNRITEWYFSCLGFQTADGDRIGLNLSRLIYEDRENTVWVNGKSYQTGPAHFLLPDSGLDSKPWKIQAFEQSRLCVDLIFEPQGARRENVSLGFLTSKFTQAFGYYTGTITVDGRTHRIVKGFGVAEKHYSKW